MTIEGDQGQWLHAKARQLKERALGTADRTRRQQFLLIAREYQKLAQQEGGAIALVGRRDTATNGGSATQVGIVTTLRRATRQKPSANSDEGSRSRLVRAFQRPGILDLTIWAILALISFALLLIPGDQTAQGLRKVIDFLGG